MAAKNVPSLHLHPIQISRTAAMRWISCYVCTSTRSLQVLLAALLLVFHGSRRVRPPYPASVLTSDHLLHELLAERSVAALNYQIVAQSAEDVQNIQNAPAVSIGPYLIESGQNRLLTAISIYCLRGENRQQVRLLYMNATAIRVWKEMGKMPKIIGEQSRPPRTALLAFGVPFSE